jgi:hypothetical protein
VIVVEKIRLDRQMMRLFGLGRSVDIFLATFGFGAVPSVFVSGVIALSGKAGSAEDGE